jgi:hypothetical protein
MKREESNDELTVEDEFEEYLKKDIPESQREDRKLFQQQQIEALELLSFLNF